jgi:hypothetical protein
MPWDISWLESTREKLQTLARENFPRFPVNHDAGELAVHKVEEDIRLHPLPSPGLPQVSREEKFNFGPVQVSYHIDSRTGHAEIRKVEVL